MALYEKGPLSNEGNSSRARLTKKIEKRRQKDTAKILQLNEPLKTPEVIYEYLDYRDLSEDQIEQTLESYSEGIDVYEAKEWDLVAIKGMWEAIFKKYKDVIRALPVGARIKLTGVGTGRDPIFISLLRGDLQIVATDKTQSMVDESIANLNWEKIEILANFIKEVDPEASKDESTNWMISVVMLYLDKLVQILKPVSPENSETGLNENADNTENKENKEWSPIVTKEVIKSFTDRIKFHQEDVLNPQDRSDSFDFSLANAVFPHLQKNRVIEAITKGLNEVKPDSKFHFNLRVDAELWEENTEGRVFCDTVLGPDRPRYFNTYTRQEFELLLDQIRHLPNPPQIEVDDNLAPHPDSNKPRFINICLTKAA